MAVSSARVASTSADSATASSANSASPISSARSRLLRGRPVLRRGRHLVGDLSDLALEVQHSVGERGLPVVLVDERGDTVLLVHAGDPWWIRI